MTVSVLLVDYASEMWGAEITLLKMAPVFREDGYELTLACPSGSFSDHWVASGFQHIPLNLTKRQGIRREIGGVRRLRPPLQLLNELRATASSIRKVARLAKSYDVIHSNNFDSHFDVAVAGRMARTSSVLDLHDFTTSAFGRVAMGLTVGLSNKAVAVSNAVKQSLPRAVHHKTSVVHRGVDLNEFVPRPIDLTLRVEIGCPSDVPLVGIVGRIDREKGIDRLISAVEMLDGDLRATHLAIVGATSKDPDYDRDVRRLASEKLGKRALFLGKRSDVASVMSCFNVLVNASDAEPLGGVIFEGQAAGVPVVAFASGGSPEMIDDGIDGILVDPIRHGALTEALQEVLRSPDLAERITKNARDRVERRATWARCCSGFEEAYAG